MAEGGAAQDRPKASSLLLHRRERLVLAMGPQVEGLLDVLFARDIVSLEERESIVCGRTPYDAARQLLCIVGSKGEDAATELVGALARAALIQVPPGFELRTDQADADATTSTGFATADDATAADATAADATAADATADDANAATLVAVPSPPDGALAAMRLHHLALVDKLDDVDVLAEQLVLDGVLSHEDRDRVTLPQQTRQQNVRKLLNLIHTKGEAAAAAFLRCVDVKAVAEKDYFPSPVEAYKTKLRRHHEDGSQSLQMYSHLGHLALDDIYTETQLHALPTAADEEPLVLTLDTLLPPPPAVAGNGADAGRRPGPPGKDVVILSGGAGSGKSVLVQKLRREWSKGAAYAEFEFLFSFSCSHLNHVKKEICLRDLLFNNCCCPDACPDKVFEYVLRHPERTLLVFDAMDEFRRDMAGGDDDVAVCASPEGAAFAFTLVANVLRGNLLKGAKKIVTSRTNSDVKVMLETHVGRNVVASGFSKDAVMAYLSKRREGAASRTTEQLLKSDPNIYSLCQIPLYCWIVSQCHGLLRQPQPPQHQAAPAGAPDSSLTITEIYLSMLEVCLCHSRPQRDHEAVFGASLPLLLKLGSLAQKALLESETSFSSSRLKEHGLTEEDFAYGFLIKSQSYRGFGTEDVFVFMHVTFQAFFAALLLVLSADRGVRDMLGHFPNFSRATPWRRLAPACVVGWQRRNQCRKLTDSEKSNLQLVSQFLSGLLSERQSAALSKMVDRGGGALRRKRGALRAHLCRCLRVHLEDLAASVRLTRRDMVSYRGHLTCDFLWVVCCAHEFGDEAVARRLARDMPSYMKLNYASVGPAHCTHLAFVLRHARSAVSAMLDNNHIEDLGLHQLLPCLHKLDQLRVSSNRITDDGIRMLVPELIKHNTLKNLVLFKNSLTDVIVPDLAKFIERSSTIEQLMLGGNEFTGAGAVLLADALKRNRSVKIVGLWGNAIGDRGAVAFAEVLEQNTPLAWLSLVGNGIGNEGVRRLSEALLKNSILQDLWLGENSLTDEEALILADVIRGKMHLEQLWLNKNKFTVLGAEAIASALKDNTCLKCVVLRDNDIPYDEYVKIQDKDSRIE
ncbi:nucleotide-binding oligomerization domain-containing protein 2-like [Lampetra planeri]